jgi:hypothetical protein
MLVECPVDLAGIFKAMYFRSMYAVELGTSGEIRLLLENSQEGAIAALVKQQPQ